LRLRSLLPDHVRLIWDEGKSITGGHSESSALLRHCEERSDGRVIFFDEVD
jgi:hypothetical protein